jgi:hypothetical protein
MATKILAVIKRNSVSRHENQAAKMNSVTAFGRKKNQNEKLIFFQIIKIHHHWRLDALS